MRFFRLTRMAHILSLIVLMLAAMTFVVSEDDLPQEDWSHVAAMDVRECGTHHVSDDTIPGCLGMMVHCVTFSNVDHALPEPKFLVVHVYHGSRAIDAESLKLEASSPPPRV
ncbi:conserved hypothetical protein [Roseovarius sp. EC-HK134]|jgi:hypothetical protein|uniref:hypothetical protein n=1 Tax=Roseovarius TaxID=74030 RepID=UPI00125675EA|nr:MULTISPECIES: hypothetical protein [Roseovarius]MBW4975985.1 hypothetical protein [Roseovarius mucosus]VVT00900.1 conserved hypothetical protein [Roseovarius sp. EC-HK134]VVT01862.1 conserved hypothetical protein [Roseovarius sp. EC-SD190]